MVEQDMMAVTVSQPYPSLIADLDKFVENRTWPTKYRGPLAIHAGQGTQYMSHREMDAKGLPRGAFVAVAQLQACVWLEWSHERIAAELPPWLSLQQFLSHTHTEGPWCWIAGNVYKLPYPIPASGAQGLWRVKDETALKLLQGAYRYGGEGDELAKELRGPDGFDVFLGEPEDCNFLRDGYDIVTRLNEQHRELRRLRELMSQAYRKLSCVAIERSANSCPEIVRVCDGQAMQILSEGFQRTIIKEKAPHESAGHSAAAVR